MAQAWIMLLGGAAIWLTTSSGDLARWGVLLGLISQPFWLVETFRQAQWGMFLLSLFYTFAWGRGVFLAWG